MSRELRPPPAPRLPNKLPLEDQVGQVLDAVGYALDQNRLLQKLDELRAKVPTVAAWDVPTPLGTMRLPSLALPEIASPKLDDRKKQVIKAALGDDLASFIEAIPYLGTLAGPISDFFEDMAMGKISEALTPEEFARFRNLDKVSPLTTWAAIQLFLKRR